MHRSFRLATAASIGLLVTFAATKEARARKQLSKTATQVGLVTAAGAWVIPALGVAYARFPNNSALLLLPLAGPWLTLHYREEVVEPLNSIVQGTLITAGVLQVGGLIVAGIGALPVYGGGGASNERRFFVAPFASPDTAGLQAGGRF